MSIASEITRLQGVKSDILTAIADKGVTVPAGSALDDCPGLIGDIPAGTNYKIIGGREYQTVLMPDGKEWMSQNLDFKFCSVGVANVPSMAAAWYMNNDEATYGLDGTRKTGLLYNSAAVDLLVSSRSALIPGWHVPTRDEWVNLANAIGENAGQKLKAANIDWVIPWNGTDDFGFKALPGGARGDNGSFFNMGFSINYWNAGFDGSERQYAGFDNGANVIYYYGPVNSANYIRLVRD